MTRFKKGVRNSHRKISTLERVYLCSRQESVHIVLDLFRNPHIAIMLVL